MAQPLDYERRELRGRFRWWIKVVLISTCITCIAVAILLGLGMLVMVIPYFH